MITIVQGESKDLVVRLTNADTQDPYDLTNVKYIKATFLDANQQCVVLLYLALVGDLALNSVTINNIDTTNIVLGMPIFGTGIPVGATVASIVTAGVSGSITISAPATVTQAGQSLTLGDISIVSAVIGKILIAITPVQSALFGVSDSASFEVQIINSGFTSIVQFPDSLQVLARIC